MNQLIDLEEIFERHILNLKFFYQLWFDKRIILRKVRFLTMTSNAVLDLYLQRNYSASMSTSCLSDEKIVLHFYSTEKLIRVQSLHEVGYMLVIFHQSFH
jgi:hypothetical protein